MRQLIMSLVLVFLAVPALSATEAKPMEPASAEVVTTVVAEAVPSMDTKMHLNEITLEERAAPNDAAAAQLAPRGSFWWVVGVVVVAGVILAVLL
jgi:hypothetical protein